MKTGFFRQVRDLKIQRKIPGGALRFEGGENTLHTILVVVDTGRSPHTSVGGSTLKKSHIITYSSSSLSIKKLMDFHMQKGSELSFPKSSFVCI
jgi:hypothetical protein